QARARIVAELDAEVGAPRGWVIPIHRTHLDDGGGATTRGPPRRKHLMLRPGDSPVGLRVPPAALSWRAAQPEPERSPFEKRGPLPVRSVGPPAGVAPQPRITSAARVVPMDQAPTTALCVERRDGRLHVFLPPLEQLEHVVELLTFIESAAAETGIPVVIEGYPPHVDR